MTPKILVHGCYNNANFGDQLILELIRARLRANAGIEAAVPWVRATDRKRVRGGLLGWLDILGAKAVVFGGGGYFQNSDDLLRRYYFPARLWQARGVPYAVLGVGVGPQLSGLCAERVRKICMGADWVIVRDSESSRLLVDSGVPVAHIKPGVDLVIGLTRSDIPMEARSAALSLLGPRLGRKKRLALHFPDYVGPRRFAGSVPFWTREPHPKLVAVVKAVAAAALVPMAWKLLK